MTGENGAAASLAAALADLQTQLPHVKKDATNPHFGKKYASLQAISAALLPLLAKLGMSFTCRPTLNAQDKLVLDYELRHVSGDVIGGQYPLGAGNPQQIGSAITYARRYALCAVTGLAPDDDDDGNEASTDDKRPSRQTPAQQRAARTSAGTPTQQRDRARRIAEERAVAQAKAQDRPMDRGPLPDADNKWQDAAPEDRPGTITSGQHKALEALLGQFYGLDSKDRDGRHNAVQQLLSLPAAPASMKDLSYSQATLARTKIVAMMAEREREAKMAAAAAPDHAQLAAGDYPEDRPG